MTALQPSRRSTGNGQRTGLHLRRARPQAPHARVLYRGHDAGGGPERRRAPRGAQRVPRPFPRAPPAGGRQPGQLFLLPLHPRRAGTAGPLACGLLRLRPHGSEQQARPPRRARRPRASGSRPGPPGVAAGFFPHRVVGGTAMGRDPQARPGPPAAARAGVYVGGRRRRRRLGRRRRPPHRRPARCPGRHPLPPRAARQPPAGPDRRSAVARSPPTGGGASLTAPT